jgi:hypothetical protein
MQFMLFAKATAASILLCTPLFGQSVWLGDPPAAPTLPQSAKSSAVSATIAPSATGAWYDTAVRETVRTAYNSVFVPTNGVSLGYTGNPANGIAGDTSAAYKAAVLARINFFRAMSGVPPVLTLDPILNQKDQQGALMLYANQQLSHTPPESWLRYTAEGAEALGYSNICAGLQSDAGCINTFMDDHGAGNSFVGHRRWFLFPNTQVMGTGDIPEGSFRLWNAVWIIEIAAFGRARPATRDPFVAWPPQGYVPYQTLYNRWSFSYPNASFTGASVSMRRNGVSIPSRIDSAADNNYGDRTIVWIPDNLSATSPSAPAKPSSDTTYSITITNVLVNGILRTFTYDVIVFDPAVAGPPPTSPGAPAVVSFSPLSGSSFAGTFTATFTQTSNNHYLGYLLFLPTPNVVMYTATGSCLVEYNKYSNGVRLIDNAGTGWLGPLSGVPIGPGAATLTNNQCSVNVADVVASVNGSTMTVRVPVTFFARLGPVLGTFLQALDSNGIWTGMTQFGNWVLPGAPQTRLGPSIVGISSTATMGTQATYTIMASHTAGASSLAMIHMLTGASIVGSPVCQFVYFPGSNVLNLINDSGTALVSPAGIVAGQPGTLANSRCSVNTALASRTQSVNNMTITLPVTYAQAFAGQKNVYFNAFDGSGLLSHWVQGSTMLVQ